MPFFEDLGNAISDVAKTVSNKTNEVVEVTKLNNKVSDKTNEMNRCYHDLGKMIYNKYKSGTLFDGDYVSLCEKITECEKNIDELKSQINEAKGCKVCPACGFSCDAGAKFCTKCGASL